MKFDHHSVCVPAIRANHAFDIPLFFIGVYIYCPGALGVQAVIDPIPEKILVASGSVGTLDNHAAVKPASREAIVHAVVGYDPLSI